MKSATAPRTGPKAHAADAPPSTAAQPGIIRLINRLRVELVDAMDRELAEYDITAPQFIVLASLATEDPVSPANICKTISYDPGAMTRMIDRLEQKGLVKRIPNPTDRRATQLALTAAGKALFPQLMAAKERVAAQFLRGFARDEVRQLEGFLHRMIANR
jgi:MarR family transcriptional regulator, multiple antibiotic resistance protein MarR